MRTSVNGSIPLCSLLWQHCGNKATRMLGTAEFAQVLERMLVHILAVNIQCLAKCQDSYDLE